MDEDLISAENSVEKAGGMEHIEEEIKSYLPSTSLGRNLTSSDQQMKLICSGIWIPLMMTDWNY